MWRYSRTSLAAGTYYLVLDSPTANSGWQHNYPFQSNYTTAPGVTFLGGRQAQFGNIDSTYTAGSTFSGIGYPVEFSVTGPLLSHRSRTSSAESDWN